FVRVTSDYILYYLEKWNFNNIKISPISYGPFSNAQLVGYTHKLINGPTSQLSVVLDKLFNTLFFKKYKKYNSKCPLFYYVTGLLS
ncbi:SAM-dependent methyltransferase, partial [Prochlorococcus sp. AH-716-G04]|nr:SAM-dependent methyltransferase [Prochlorococcus sp. AH-716-G04]MDC3160554.1 SAM-dependent methyltransferase [Prochlorococcus sp. AH-716-G04]